MAKYRKKPVIIEAVQIAHIDPAIGMCILHESFPRWLKDAVDQQGVRAHEDRVLIDTLEGTMTGRPGDYIIRGVEGEIYPCKESVSKATYERY